MTIINTSILKIRNILKHLRGDKKILRWGREANFTFEIVVVTTVPLESYEVTGVEGE